MLKYTSYKEKEGGIPLEFDERLKRQMQFCLKMDQEKMIGRQTYLSDGSRKEDDAEHAWHMAVMALVLSEYANTNLDLLRTVSMILIHDVVEIEAGDTYAYDEEGKKTQRQREVAAADHLFSMLPKDQEEKFRGLWDEFEAGETPEAKFARTMDNIQPAMLNDAAQGKAWEEKGVRLSQILKRNQATADGSETLWAYTRDNFIEPNVKNKKIIKD